MTVDHIYCGGCGVRIQTTDKESVGYTPKSALNRENVLCQRCFRLKHYNEVQDVSIADDDFLNMIASIRKTNGLIVHIIDVFDVDGTLINGLPCITGDNPIILVANKVDLLPKSINKRKLENWLRAKAKESGIKVLDVFLISSTKRHGIAELGKALENVRNQEDVYIVGTTNVGKSTFINTLIEQSTGLKHAITTSYFPGTTLGFIKIPLDERSFLVDTPGIVNRKQFVHYVSKADLKLIIPDKEIKPRIYQLNPGQTLFFGGLARLDFLTGLQQSFVCYFSNQLPIHRTKLEKADDLYAKHKGGLLSPPNQGTLNTWPDLTAEAYKIKDGKTDIVFPGLGWVSMVDGHLTVQAHTPEGIPATLRKALV